MSQVPVLSHTNKGKCVNGHVEHVFTNSSYHLKNAFPSFLRENCSFVVKLNLMNISSCFFFMLSVFAYMETKYVAALVCFQEVKRQSGYFGCCSELLVGVLSPHQVRKTREERADIKEAPPGQPASSSSHLYYSG